MEVEDRLYRFADSKTPPDPFLKIPEENSSTSIVIDNGITFLVILLTSKTRLGCGTKSMLTFPAADIVKLYEIISNDALILRQKAD